MKKFHFSMETVLRYKEQRLDALRTEHAAAIARVREQEAVLEELVGCFNRVNREYREKKECGMTVADAMSYDIMLRAQEVKIRSAEEELEVRRQEEERKREQVIEAKTEKATIEKLKEKKLAAYHKQEQKVEEQMIDEFVSTMRVSSGAH